MVSTRARELRSRRRAGERGAAVFIVLLVIMMLTGIGVFATRAASLATTASGFDRQMTQTHYIAEYAILTTTAELSTNNREAYVRTMAQRPDTNCKSILDNSLSPPAPVLNSTCYRFGYADLERQMQLGGNTMNVLVMPYVPGSPPVGGGLGFSPIQADWMVEMTDLGPASPPVAGTDLTSAGAAQVQYMAVTLNATGQVRPQTNNQASVDPIVGKAASLENARAHIIVGPLPKL